MRKQIEYKDNTQLPFRLKVYKLFKEQPKLIKLRKTSNYPFEVQKIKATFMKEYLNPTETELELNNLVKERTVDLGGQLKLYNMADLKYCEQLNKQLDNDLNECKRTKRPLSLINNYHPSKNRLRKHQDKLIQLNQLLKFSECITKEDERNDEFSKQIELLGDRWYDELTHNMGPIYA